MLLSIRKSDLSLLTNRVGTYKKKVLDENLIKIIHLLF